MKKLIILFGLFLLLILLSSANAQDYVPGEIMIDIRHEYLPISPVTNPQGIIETGLPSVDSLNAQYGIYQFKKLGDHLGVSRGFYLLNFPDSLDLNQVLSSYLADNNINMGNPNYIRQPFNVTPDDSFFTQQWGLSKMNCPEAWRHTNGSPGIIIQIIDGGTDYGHPDQVHNIWQNLGEDSDGDGHTIEWDPQQYEWVLDPGDDNNIDDDENDYPDDFVGWDFMFDDEDPVTYGGVPTWGDHGDKTAGTAAAVTNNWLSEEEAIPVCDNRIGTVAGTSWFSKIMIAKIWNDGHAVEAIEYGMNNGANIISMSWGDYDDNSQLHAQLDEAWSAGLLLISGAGRDGISTPVYPAAYENVIAVAATDINDVKKDYSHYGTWVDICAPGENWSPSWSGKPWRYCYTDWEGTSCATPFVAGVAALVWTCNLNATNAEVRAAIETTAVNIDGFNPGYAGLLGSGRVNALEAVKVFRPVPPASGDCNTDGIINVGDIVYLVGYLYRGGDPPDPLCVGDVNDDGIINMGDVLYLRNYLYWGGPPPLDGCD